MATEQITIQVDAEATRVFKSASAEERRKLEVMLDLRLKEATGSRESLQDVMSEVSHKSQQRGLTPEILRSILDSDVR
jgi:hypothetical protein